MNTSDVAGIILAGGRSSRMGGNDKALVELDGQSLLEISIKRLAPQVIDFCVCRHQLQAPLGSMAKNFNFKNDLNIVTDETDQQEGPLWGILSGLEWVASVSPQIKWALCVAVDTPFFPTDLAVILQERQRDLQDRKSHNLDKIIVSCSQNRMHYCMALWPVQTRFDLRAWLETCSKNRKIRAFMDTIGFETVQIGDIKADQDGFDPFFNINSSEDLNQARRLGEKRG